jgi:L-lactate dehydrogenase complex protein LldG
MVAAHPGGVVVSAREEVLARIRSAIGQGPRPATDVPRTYATGSGQPGDEPALVELLIDRLLDYRAGVRRTDAAALPAAIDEALRAGLARRVGGPPPSRPHVVVPPQLPPTWLGASAAEHVVDDGLSTADLDACDAVVTAATLAIAETGTIVLDGSPDQGRRALTLVPDVHVCVLRTEQIVGSVPEAMPRIEPRRPLTWISVPSATSDIELDRVEGVHGPRILEVIIVDSR